MNSFKVSYVTTLPKEGNAPRLTISGDVQKTYKVGFYERGVGLVSSGECKTNQTIICNSRQWYTNWEIIVVDENESLVFTDRFDVENQVVFIKIDAYALGDNIAWVPYVEWFRRERNCKVICSTFYNELFVDTYPEIMFVKPNTSIENVYAQYYVGASSDENKVYSSVNSKEVNLQMVASSILGLPFEELRPKLHHSFEKTSRIFAQKYVTLSEFGSGENKSWKAQDGWQQVVDYLNQLGFMVVVISKEPTNLKNVIDRTGDYPLSMRMYDIYHSEFHLGISSGLSWLAWAMGKHVLMISDVTPRWHEFQTDVTRLCSNDLNSVDYEIEGFTEMEEVVKKIGELVLSRYL
jgi:autotransporter strand-loop-strand O-heptosyltransferase